MSQRTLLDTLVLGALASPLLAVYAVQAFEHGALDDLVKPFDGSRPARTVRRLQRGLRAGPA